MMKLIDMRTVTGHTNTPVQVADVIHFGAQLPVSIPLDDYMTKTYGASWEQDADSLREILTNGDSMVLNQSGVEIADAVEYDAEWEAHCDETSATRASDYPF